MSFVTSMKRDDNVEQVNSGSHVHKIGDGVSGPVCLGNKNIYNLCSTLNSE